MAEGVKQPPTKKALKGLLNEFMELKLAPKVFDALVAQLRDVVAQIRGLERQVMALCVRDAGMPRKDFIATFPKNETNLHWIDKHIRSKRKHSSALAKLQGRRAAPPEALAEDRAGRLAHDRRRSRRSTARFRSARRKRGARRRRWSRRTCVS